MNKKSKKVEDNSWRKDYIFLKLLRESEAKCKVLELKLQFKLNHGKCDEEKSLLI